MGNTRKNIDGWTWNEIYAQYERGDFRVVEYNDDGRIYHRLQIRCNKHPELDRSAPIEFEHLDVVCRTLVDVFREQYGVKLKY